MIWRVYVPTQLGTHVICATGTKHRPTAVAMQRMIQDLGPKGSRDWSLLELVTTRRVTLGALYDAYRMGATTALKARADDIDLEPLVREWYRWLGTNRAELTVVSYRQKIGSLVIEGKPFLRSALTTDAVTAWLAGLNVGTSTQRSYLAALQSFVAFAAQKKLVRADLLADVASPTVTTPPTRFLELEDVRRVINASPHPERALFALLYGGALEISVAVKLTKRDLDSTSRSVRAAGSKAYTRDRVAMLADWAWPIIADHAKGLLPDAPLFPGANRISCGKVHRKVLKAIGLRGKGQGRVSVTMHDARHHWAVRMLRAGAPVEIVSRQLGHASAKMTLDIYGRFVPDYAQLREWEARAHAMDTLRVAATASATEAKNAVGKSK